MNWPEATLDVGAILGHGESVWVPIIRNPPVSAEKSFPTTKAKIEDWFLEKKYLPPL